MKEIIKKNLNYIVAGLFAITMIPFLFSPLLNYITKADGVKTTHPMNIVTLFNPEVAKLWMPIILIIDIFLIVSGLLFAFLFRKQKKAHDVFTTILLISCAVLLIIIFMHRAIFDYYCQEGMIIIDNFYKTTVGWGFGVLLFCDAIIFLCAISFSSYSKQSTRSICEDGILISLALVLNFIKIPIGASGGSINLQMLPLMIIALRRGPVSGFISGGVIYGLLSILCDGYTFADYPFDYVVGFGSVGILGLFNPLIFPKEEKPLWQREIWLFVGGVLVTLTRFIGSTTSSILVYSYSFEAAAIYNAVYIPVSGAAATGILMFLLPSITLLNRIYPNSLKAE